MRFSLCGTSLLLLYTLCRYGDIVQAFTFHRRVQWQTKPKRPFFLLLATAGRGMGGGVGMATGRKKKKSKERSSKSSSSHGQSVSSFNVASSLLRSEKRYDELSLANTKTITKDDAPDLNDIMTREYVVAARSSSLVVSDWVPVAQLVLARTYDKTRYAPDGGSDPLIRVAVSTYCRELYHVASQGSRVFQSIPRTELQYSVEPIESWTEHVYEAVVQAKQDKSKDETMSQKEALGVLQLKEDERLTARIKKAYRSKSLEWHPDTFVDADEAKQAEARREYGRIKLAYETLLSGVRDGSMSWYESLGGRARSDFRGPVELTSLPDAERYLRESGVESAIVGLDPNLVQSFVARCHNC